MNLLTKKTPWVAASLLAVASVFAQQGSSGRNQQQQQKCIDQGHEMSPMQMMAGYNSPARIDVRGAWDFYVSGGFTYWQATQDNMELAIINNASAATTSLNGNVVNMSFSFEPGFQVGLGMNFDHDNWDGYAQYTWFRGNSTQTTTQDANATPSLVVQPLWGAPDVQAGTTYFSGSENWKLRMDILDTQLARSYYVGTNLTFRPYFGLRAAWIRQRAVVSYSTPNAANEYSMTQISNSWGLGPETGIATNWLLGYGFRIYGQGEGDILYTQYTTLANSESRSASGTVATDGVNSVRQTDLGTMRTHLSLEIGLGWGSYFDNNNWHVDLSAGYGFQVFFSQNMFRKYVDDVMNASSILPNGDLYVQGLTASLRFDF